MEASKQEEWRSSVSTLVERIFAQRIYRNFIDSLCELIQVGCGLKDFGINKTQIEFLNNSFVRDKLGSKEQGYLCMFPLWNGQDEREEENIFQFYAVVGDQEYGEQGSIEG